MLSKEVSEKAFSKIIESFELSWYPYKSNKRRKSAKIWGYIWYEREVKENTRG